jgi:hypothetical protein
VEVVVQDADEVGSGQDDAHLEGDLRGVGAGRQLAAADGGAGLLGEQVTPLLLDAGDFVVHAAGLRAYFGGRGDEEAPAGEDPPLDVGEEALTQGEQALPSRFGGAKGGGDDLGDDRL